MRSPAHECAAVRRRGATIDANLQCEPSVRTCCEPAANLRAYRAYRDTVLGLSGRLPWQSYRHTLAIGRMTVPAASVFGIRW